MTAYTRKNCMVWSKDPIPTQESTKQPVGVPGVRGKGKGIVSRCRK